MKIAKIEAFKQSGKFYTEETLIIPDDVPIFDIPEYVNKSLGDRLSEMHIHISGDSEGMYPMMIPSDKRAQ